MSSISITLLDLSPYRFAFKDTAALITKQNGMQAALEQHAVELNAFGVAVTGAKNNAEQSAQAAQSWAVSMTEIENGMYGAKWYANQARLSAEAAQLAVLDAQSVAAGNVIDDGEAGALGWSGLKISNELSGKVDANDPRLNDHRPPLDHDASKVATGVFDGDRIPGATADHMGGVRYRMVADTLYITTDGSAP